MREHKSRRRHSHSVGIVDEKRRMLVAQWVALSVLALITLFLIWQAMSKV